MPKDKKKTPALAEAEESAPAPKKSRKKRLIIVLLLLLFMLSGIGAGGYWWFFMRNPGVLPFTQGGDDPASGQPAETQDGKTPESAAGAGKKEGGDAAGRIEKPAALPRSSGVVLPLPMVTVNLYDSGGRRYLKLGMEVEANKDISQAIKANEPRIRDAVIMLLAGKSYNEIASPDGKVMLKAEVANRLNQILGEQRIIRVYFTDFVVQ
ncbi:MAG: flagellar basal body-associated FliL family protein [Desulfovibrio sp.]|nr:flagellar basal body-associated FliL family protein [Desulfovibrio sp.]